jgi:hypothetical protein
MYHKWIKLPPYWVITTSSATLDTLHFQELILLRIQTVYFYFHLCLPNEKWLVDQHFMHKRKKHYRVSRTKTENLSSTYYSIFLLVNMMVKHLFTLLYIIIIKSTNFCTPEIVQLIRRSQMDSHACHRYWTAVIKLCVVGLGS